MKNFALTALLCAVALPAAASGDRPPENADAIRAHLSAQGYEVRKIEREDGLVEAYVIKDGQRQELYLDAAMNILRVKSAD